MKSIVLALSFFSSFQSYAQATDYAALFCQNQVQAICQDNPNQMEARSVKALEHINAEVETSIQEVAIQFSIPAIALLSDFTIANYLSSQNEARRNQIIWALYTVGMRNLKSKYEDKGKAVFDGNKALLLSNFHQTIDRILPNAGQENDRLEFHKRLNEIKFVSVTDLESYSFYENPDRNELMNAFMQRCGVFGNNQNAFAYASQSGSRYLMVCPGWLFGAIQAGMSSITNFVNLLYVVSHELGHHVDAGEYPEFFKNYLASLTTSDGYLLSNPPRSTTKFSLFRKFSDADRIQSHQKEITADFWASESLATYLVSSFKEQVFQPRIDIIRESFGPLCGTGDDGVHPSGEFRAGRILGVNPSVRNAMLLYCPYGYLN